MGRDSLPAPFYAFNIYVVRITKIVVRNQKCVLFSRAAKPRGDLFHSPGAEHG